jgi:hypothetical protein
MSETFQVQPDAVESCFVHVVNAGVQSCAGMLSVLLALKKRPVIRYANHSEVAKRLAFDAQVTAIDRWRIVVNLRVSRLQKRMKDEASLFHFGPVRAACLLLIACSCSSSLCMRARVESLIALATGGRAKPAAAVHCRSPRRPRHTAAHSVDVPGACLAPWPMQNSSTPQIVRALMPAAFVGFQAMAHELLTIDSNRVDMSAVPGVRADQKVRSFVRQQTSNCWVQQMSD